MLKRFALVIVSALVIAMVLSSVDPTVALAPAKTPQWDIGDSWRYGGKLIWLDLNVTLNVTGKGQVTVGSETYDVFILDYYIISKLGPLVSTMQGKQYYCQYDYTLVKTESTYTENNKVKTTVVTYDPPKRQVEFPMMMGNEWNETLNVKTVETVDGTPKTTVSNEENSYKISGVDQVTTALGTIDCYRITLTNRTGGTRDYWYSGEVGNFVKLDFIPAWANSEVTLFDYSYAPNGGGGGHTENPLSLLLIVMIVVIVVIIVVVAVVVSKKRAKKAASVTVPTPALTPVASTVPIATPLTQPPPPGNAPQSQSMIEDVFLVYKDGRLIHHDARRLKPEVDQDVLGGMLTAIQDFVSRSFPSSDGTPGSVKEIRYANSRILLENGRFVYLAVVTDVADPALLQTRMASLVRLLEGRCANELQTWDGNMEAVAEAKRMTRLMLSDEPLPIE